MDHPLIWIFLFFGFGCTYVFRREYYYVNMSVTFIQAQNYCREKFTDVATITSQEDISMLPRPSSNTGWVWIGLEDDPKSWQGVMGDDANSWRWSVTGLTSKTSYCNWNPGDPDYRNGRETCVAMIANGKWIDRSCDKLTIAICFDTNATGKSYVATSTQLTWKNAQTYCRQYHKDLAIIENAEDNNVVQSTNTTNSAWIGLYRVPWTWSDKSNSTFRNFAVGKPDNAQGINHCAVEGLDHFWVDVPCANNLAFFCSKDPELKTMLGMKIQTDADMTDPAINTQILQEIGAAIRNQGWTNFNLKWKIYVTEL